MYDISCLHEIEMKFSLYLSLTPYYQNLKLKL